MQDIRTCSLNSGNYKRGPCTTSNVKRHTSNGIFSYLLVKGESQKAQGRPASMTILIEAAGQFGLDQTLTDRDRKRMGVPLDVCGDDID